MIADLIQTLRALRRAPWYSLTVIGVIALGMMLATTVFAVVDGVLFRPLPYPDAGRLFKITAGFVDLESATSDLLGVSVADLANWSAAAPDVGFTAFQVQPWGGFGGGVNDDAAVVVRVQANFFDVIGVRPLVGGFSPEDLDRETPTRPVIITHGLWQGRFQRDPGVIGRTVEIDPRSHFGFRIVGIMPRGFTFPSERGEVRFITPFVRERDRPSPFIRFFGEAIARVPASMGTDALRDRVEAGMRATAAVFPGLGPKPPEWSERGWRALGPFDRGAVQPLSSALGSRSRPLFSAVFFAVLLLVGLGALNVSGLMAARTLDRGRELGLRRVLGASAAAVGRLVFTEAFTLILVGAVLGLIFVQPLLHLTLSLLPEEIVLLKPARIDWRVVAFLGLGAVALAVATAIWPIRRALRGGAAAVGDGGRTSARTRPVGRFVVIAVQVAGALVLTVTGGLLVGSLLAVYSNERPINTDDVVAIEGYLQGEGAGMRKSTLRPALVRPILERLRGVPGVTAVAATSAELLSGGSSGARFTPPAGAVNTRLEVDAQAVTADYYRVLQPHVTAGRLPNDAELAANARVVVVSEGVTRAYWPSASAVGQLLTEQGDPEPYAVIGVVRDVHWFAWDRETASIYGPYGLLDRWSLVTFMIQTDGRTGRAVTGALQALHEVDSLLRPVRAATLDALFADSVRPRRFKSWLFGSLAAAGLVVVGIGILGLIAMSTARRTKEIGIRHALGATRARIVSLLLREQLMPVAIGLVAGGLISVWAVTFVSSYLYGVTTADPRVWVSAVMLILGTAAIGALAPAIRASRTDPVQALRVE